MIDTIRVRIDNESLYSSLERYKNTNFDESKRAYVNLKEFKERLEAGEVITFDIEQVKDLNSNLIVSLFEKGIDINIIDYFKLPSGSWNREITVILDTLNRSVILEFSLNKYLFGHNLYNYVESVFHLYQFLSDFYSRFGLKLTLDEFNSISLYRLDLAYNYRFDFDVLSVLQTVYHHSSRHKRKRIHFYDTSLMFVGSWYSLKIYDKHSEFKKHDLRELRKHLDNMDIDKIRRACGYLVYNYRSLEHIDKNDKQLVIRDILNYLYEYSINLTRVEVTIRRKKLEYDEIVTLGDLSVLDLEGYYMKFLEDMGLLGIRGGEMDKLYEMIDDVNLLSFVAFIKEFGIERAKYKYKRSTFYYYKKKLKDKYGIDIYSLNFEDTNIDFRVDSRSSLVSVAV